MINILFKSCLASSFTLHINNIWWNRISRREKTFIYVEASMFISTGSNLKTVIFKDLKKYSRRHFVTSFRIKILKAGRLEGCLSRETVTLL